MKYIILAHESEADYARRTDPDKSQAYWDAWQAYGKALRESGVTVAAAGLQPPQTATTVRVREGKRQVHDGPYAETKEMLGGFFLVDVPDLDAALELAARCPAALTASVEVRPLMPSCDHD
jgi:hypothetical protein